MSTEQERISYALAKQVPDMARGFTISTSYGDIQIDAENAEAFQRLAQLLLTNKLAVLIAEAKGEAHGC